MKRLALVAGVVVAAMLLAAPPAWAVYNVTPNCVTGGQSVACGAGWYTGPVELYWTWSPSGGSARPGTCVTQSFANDVATEAFCDVTGPAGSGSGGQYINVETSSPTATVVPSRPPDSSGWYNHPVTGAPSASSFSGIASCAATTYAGPSTTAATVSATCVDHAGKTVTATSSPFAYDTTPPSLAVAASPADQSVALSWQTGGDPAPVESVTVTRSSPTGHRAAVTIYHGDADRYVDRHVRNGIHYTYTITAFDQAGHATVHAVGAIPGPRLLTPTRDARVSAPPILRWTPVHGATYYNVQLYRRGKLLSIWPSHAHLRLRRHWRFDGRRYRLAPGRYRWFVWPGFGKRSAARYGHPIGSGTFIVVR